MCACVLWGHTVALNEKEGGWLLRKHWSPSTPAHMCVRTGIQYTHSTILLHTCAYTPAYSIHTAPTQKQSYKANKQTTQNNGFACASHIYRKSSVAKSSLYFGALVSITYVSVHYSYYIIHIIHVIFFSKNALERSQPHNSDL